MATIRSDVIIPEVFTPYIEEQTTLRSDFLQSGVVAQMPELNVNEGGDTVQVPSFTADLTGDAERLTDTQSLTPGKISARKQIGVVLHRGRAWESRDLARLAAGADPMAAIGNKVSAYIANQQQKDLLATCAGVFGALGSSNAGAAFVDLTFDAGGSGETPLSPRHLAKARSLLGDRGELLSTVAMHSTVFYDLLERRAIDYVTADEARITPAASNAANPAAFAGSVAEAYTQSLGVPFYMGMRVVVTDDIQQTGSSPNKKFAVYFFTAGAIGTGEQQALRTETDRDILAKSDAMSIDWHNVYHPMGARWKTTAPVNPLTSDLSTAANWEKVFETKNIGIVRGTVTSNFD